MKRIIIILLFFLLLVGGFMIVSKSIDSAGSFAVIDHSEYSSIPVPTEKWSEEHWNAAGYYKNTFEEWVPEKTLEEYYSNRMYYGAPPHIPHPVKDEMTLGGKDCLKCHQNGGFVQKWDAYAPMAPHPEKINCRQCHVPQNTTSLFQPTNWEKEKAPSVGDNNALETSPPVIPHQLQLHENCLSCHAGPSAPKEIRVSHPERINCRQCHVFNNKETVDIGDFSRTKAEKDEN